MLLVERVKKAKQIHLNYYKKSVFFILMLLMGISFMFKNALADTFRIIALGDSTTAGTPLFLSPIENPPNGSGEVKNQYTYWIQQQHPDWEVLNAGVNAERIDQIAKRLQRDVFSKNPDLIIFMAGVNDVYQGESEKVIYQRLSEVYQSIHEKNIPFIACSILPYNSANAKTLHKIQTINQWIRENAPKWGGAFCDTYQAVEHPSNEGKLIATSDGLHPDIQAHQLLAQTLGTCINSLELN